MITDRESFEIVSKAFGFSFAESLREELRGSGVSVTALLPGATHSDFHANAGMENTIGREQYNDRHNPQH
jgi:short-subunit dehydrogenase